MFHDYQIHWNCQDVGDGGRRIKFSKRLLFTTQTKKKNFNNKLELTMWLTGMPKDLLFFAMMAHRPGSKLNSNTIQASVAQKMAPPKYNAHTSNTHTHACAHNHTPINRKIHHLVLPVTSCLEGKSCHSNKPQKRKLGCQVATVVLRVLRNTAMWK